MTDRGLFLVLEGVEGSGKSTQARMLVDWLRELGVPHTLAREPGGTPVGEAVRTVLLDSRELDMPAETELLLLLAARAAFVRDVVRPALAGGQVMVADRFELSTFAYQGEARGLGLDRVRALNRFATGGLRPDLTLVLDLPASAGRGRQDSSGKASDRIEREGARFHERVEAAYSRLAEHDPDAVIVDAALSPEDVHRQIRRLLASRFPEPFMPRGG